MSCSNTILDGMQRGTVGGTSEARRHGTLSFADGRCSCKLTDAAVTAVKDSPGDFVAGWILDCTYRLWVGDWTQTLQTASDRVRGCV